MVKLIHVAILTLFVLPLSGCLDVKTKMPKYRTVESNMAGIWQLTSITEGDTQKDVLAGKEYGYLIIQQDIKSHYRAYYIISSGKHCACDGYPVKINNDVYFIFSIRNIPGNIYIVKYRVEGDILSVLFCGNCANEVLIENAKTTDAVLLAGILEKEGRNLFNEIYRFKRIKKFDDKTLPNKLDGYSF